MLAPITRGTCKAVYLHRKDCKALNITLNCKLLNSSPLHMHEATLLKTLQRWGKNSLSLCKALEESSSFSRTRSGEVNVTKSFYSTHPNRRRLLPAGAPPVHPLMEGRRICPRQRARLGSISRAHWACPEAEALPLRGGEASAPVGEGSVNECTLPNMGCHADMNPPPPANIAAHLIQSPRAAAFRLWRRSPEPRLQI